MLNYLLIDVSWLFVRYYYVHKDRGYRDAGIFGFMYFMNLLYRNIKEFKHIYFVLDGDHSSDDKKKLYPDYKDGRAGKEDVYKNFNDFLMLISVFPKSSIIRNQFREADETIAYLAIKYAKQAKVLVYSGDKDMLQLTGLSNNIKVSEQYKEGAFIKLTDKDIFMKFKNSKKEDFTRISENKRDILKYRVLSGDPSDNIPSPIKGLRDMTKKYLIGLWKDDILTQDILAQIIIDTEDADLRLKLASAFNTIMLNYKLMDLGVCEKDYKLIKFTKKINPKVSKEELNRLVKRYKLDKYESLLTRLSIL